MAFRVRLPNDVIVEADTEQDLRTILALVGAAPVTSSATKARPRQNGIAPDSVSDRLVAFYDRLQSNEQKKVLHALAQFDDWIDDDELRERVGITGKRSALGAYMAALTRNAKAVSLNFGKHILDKQKKWKPGPARRPFYLYRLRPEMRDLIRERLPELSRQAQLTALPFNDAASSGAN